MQPPYDISPELLKSIAPISEKIGISNAKFLISPLAHQSNFLQIFK